MTNMKPTNNNTTTKEDTKNSTLPLVPETLLKKRHDLDESKARRAAKIVNKNNKRFSKTGKFYVTKPER
jgi:hypothetical protein